MFPQRGRTLHQPYSYYHPQQQPFHMQPQRRGLFGSSRQTVQSGIYSQQQIPMAYYQNPQPFATHQQQVPQQQPKLSFLRNEQGQIDFQKIGGGVQTVMGLVNQVSPMVKMFSGFLK